MIEIGSQLVSSRSERHQGPIIVECSSRHQLQAIRYEKVGRYMAKTNPACNHTTAEARKDEQNMPLWLAVRNMSSQGNNTGRREDYK